MIPSNTGATGTTTLVKAKAKGGGEKPRVRVRAATQAVPIRGVGGAVLKEILLKGRREVDVRLVHLLAFTHEEIRHLVYDEPAFTAHILCNELSKDMWAQPDSVMTLLFSGTDMTDFRKRVTVFCDKYAWQVRTWIVERVEAMKAPAQDQEKIPY